MIVTTLLMAVLFISIFIILDSDKMINKYPILREKVEIQYLISILLSFIIASSIPMNISAYKGTVQGTITSVNPHSGLLVETCEATLDIANSEDKVHFTVPDDKCGIVRFNLDNKVDLIVSVQIKTAWWQGNSHVKFVSLTLSK